MGDFMYWLRFVTNSLRAINQLILISCSFRQLP